MQLCNKKRWYIQVTSPLQDHVIVNRSLKTSRPKLYCERPHSWSCKEIVPHPVNFAKACTLDASQPVPNQMSTMTQEVRQTSDPKEQQVLLQIADQAFLE